MAECADLAEFERKYLGNQKVEGYGIEGVTQHFPCPFCAEPDWHVVRLIDFGDGTEPIECEHCHRVVQIVVERDRSSTRLYMVKRGGPPQPDWFRPPMAEGDDLGSPTAEIRRP